jgi:thiol:disulfide interchange protein DsbD
MFFRCAGIVPFSLMVLSFVGANAAPVQAKHAQVELVAKQAEIAPGSNALLGLHFVLEKGWHIYWKNPGDSGQPPMLQWGLPQGFSTGEIEWPVPERLQASPELADYGYQDDVLLLVPLNVASDAKSGAAAQIILHAKWLICREVCLPDRAELKLHLPVGSATKDDSSRSWLFSSSEQHLPKPLPPGWKIVAIDSKSSFVLNVSAPGSLGRVQFFPADPGQIDNAAAQRVRPTAKGVNLKLKKSELLLKPIAVLRGVLVVRGNRAYEIEAPVRPARQ